MALMQEATFRMHLLKERSNSNYEGALGSGPQLITPGQASAELNAFNALTPAQQATTVDLVDTNEVAIHGTATYISHESIDLLNAFVNNGADFYIEGEECLAGYSEPKTMSLEHC